MVIETNNDRIQWPDFMAINETTMFIIYKNYLPLPSPFNIYIDGRLSDEKLE